MFVPFVAAKLSADVDTELALRQLGQRTPGIVVARTLALDLAIDALLLPPLSAAAAIAFTHERDVTLAVVFAGALGVGLVGLVLAGATALAAALMSRESAAAAALAVVVAGGASVVIVMLDLPGSFAMPSAALALFTRGLVDARDIASLAAGALGLAFAGAILAATTAPLERRAVRAGVVIVAMLAVCGASSQLRLSWDATPTRAHSLPAAMVEQLAKVGDPVEVTVYRDAGDPAWAWERQHVLGPLGRVVKLHVKRAEPSYSPATTPGDE
ncbi:MAG: hypothetical protein A2138_14090 [Deltaproteobacteria bacterium RBG_16_71_12]|nr:MAG: hypothetical protein A2138_14090 [Deltaproteobacteria bacterium RBG_16_71_12]